MSSVTARAWGLKCAHLTMEPPTVGGGEEKKGSLLSDAPEGTQVCLSRWIWVEMNTRDPVRLSQGSKGLGNQEKCGEMFRNEPWDVRDPLEGSR